LLDKRRPGRTGKNRMDIIRRDLKDMDTAWDEADELATITITKN